MATAAKSQPRLVKVAADNGEKIGSELGMRILRLGVTRCLGQGLTGKPLDPGSLG